jgi:hypothetical protein
VAGCLELSTNLQEQELDEHLAAAARRAQLLGLSDDELIERLERSNAPSIRLISCRRHPPLESRTSRSIPDRDVR